MALTKCKECGEEISKETEKCLTRVMKTLILAPIYFFIMCSPCVCATDGPPCTQSELWENIINNAYSMAEDCAMDKYPIATFIPLRNEWFSKFCVTSQ